MSKPGTYDIRVSLTKNRLYIVLQGFLTDAELHIAQEKLREQVSKLKPGFDIITDISTFKPATPQGAEEIKKAQQHIAAQGVRRVIRVVGKEVLPSIQMSRTAKTAGYVADTASSIAEAERMLNEL